MDLPLLVEQQVLVSKLAQLLVVLVEQQRLQQAAEHRQCTVVLAAVAVAESTLRTLDSLAALVETGWLLTLDLLLSVVAELLALLQPLAAQVLIAQHIHSSAVKVAVAVEPVLLLRPVLVALADFRAADQEAAEALAMVLPLELAEQVLVDE